MLEGATSKVLVADATISGQEERLAGGEERQPGVLVSPVMIRVNITQD